MSKLRCGVIGVGYLGRFHAQKYQKLSNVDLIGVCDINLETAQLVAKELSVTAYDDYHHMLNHVDAVSIASTTKTHYAIAKACLQKGIHVLLEKPMTETVAEAKELVAIAKEQHVKFQIGHLERFNAAHIALDSHLEKPLFIESQRLAPFILRGTDVNVILDLMIHDIDLIQTMIHSPIKHIEAQGAPVLSSSIDIANARITFENHCVANVTASRVSFKAERKTRIFQANSYISIDYHNKKIAVFKKGPGEMFPGIPEIISNESVFEQSDAIFAEIHAFVDCIENNTTPAVTGEEGCNALETAEKITHLILENLNRCYESP